MKKAFLFLFILLLGISFISCKQNAGINFDDYSLSENLMSSEFVFLGEAQWEYRTNLLLSTKLPPMYKNYYFYLELETWDNYEHERKAEFNFCDSNWTGWYVFTNERKTDISKESWGKYSISTRKKTTGTLLITLSQEEAEEIAKKGLRIEGYGLTLKTLKVYSDKVADNPADSLETQYKKKKPRIEKDISYYADYAGYKLPIIHITTKDSQDILKKEYYSSMIDVANCNDSYKLNGIEAGVKVRGNSTSWGEEKPYRIKFTNKKQGMLGLHNGKEYKSWVLLKTGWAVAMDYLGFNLAHKIYESSYFDYYTSDATYVHVIVNGYYKGLYLLCEQNQVNEGRVDVYENKSKDKDTKVGYMIELDNYAWDDKNPAWNIEDEDERNKLGFPVGSGFRLINGRWEYRQGLEDYHFTLDYKQRNENGEKVHVPLTDINGETRQIDSDDFTLKNDVYSDEQVVFIQKYMKGVWDICYNAIEKGDLFMFDDEYNVVPADGVYSTPKAVCDAIIDLESLCNEMILEELVRDNDVGAGSLYMAIDFHNKQPGDKYYKLTFECPWDFNWAYSPITNDRDGGTYWNGKKQYFAGAWQSKEVGDDRYERSHSWFILFNNAPWFRKMLREKWERIGAGNLTELVNKVERNLEPVLDEANLSQSNTDFVLDRITYINNNLWLD
jgi:hypothetical protein